MNPIILMIYNFQSYIKLSVSYNYNLDFHKWLKLLIDMVCLKKNVNGKLVIFTMKSGLTGCLGILTDLKGHDESGIQ